jgi:hypothetical protein
MIGSGNLHEGVYVFKGEIHGAAFATTQRDNTFLWHSRMGHPSD